MDEWYELMKVSAKITYTHTYKRALAHHTHTLTQSIYPYTQTLFVRLFAVDTYSRRRAACNFSAIRGIPFGNGSPHTASIGEQLCKTILLFW